MPNPSQGQAMNAPVWNSNTWSQMVMMSGGPDPQNINGYYVIISNTSANNIWVGPGAGPGGGIQVAPGESFETAIVPNSPLMLMGTAGQMVTIIEYIA